MAVVTRIVGLSLFMGLLGALLAQIALGIIGIAYDHGALPVMFSCVGAIVGAIAGAANEIVASLSRPSASPPGSK